MKAVIIGATGATGSMLVQYLLERTEVDLVTALVKSPKLQSHPKLNQVVVDFDNLSSYSDLIVGDVAFSCLGTTLKIAGSKEAQWKVDYNYQYEFAQLAERSGIPNFVLLSAIGANSHSTFFYNKLKGTLEDDVRSLDFNKLIIVKPSLLIRPNTDRKSENWGVGMIKFFNSLGLLKKQRPLSVDLVAKAMYHSINDSTTKFTQVYVDDIIRLSK